MRICPRCGHVDPECWRHLRWSLYPDYCHIEELLEFEPDLAKEILDRRPTVKGPLKRGVFVYMLTKSMHVRRMSASDFTNYGGFRRERQHGSIESARYAERISKSDEQRSLKEWI